MENAQTIAAHESPRTTKVYDRTRVEISLDEIERVRFCGSLENAQTIAAHESPRTTKLYDRTRVEISLDEIERVRF